MVFAIILAALVYNGLFVLLPLLAFFCFRFPKSYWLFLIIFSASLVLLHFTNRTHTFTHLSGEQATYTAQIVRIRRRTDERQTAVINIDGQQIFMTFHDTYPQLMPGQTITLSGRLAEVQAPTVPHRFNFRDFLHLQGIYLTIHTSEVTIIHSSFSPWRVQHDIADWMRSRFPPLTASYLQSFFLGLRDDMDEDTMIMFANLGILQLFSISGVNVTLITGILKNTLKRVGLIDIFVDAITIIFCICFIFVAGGTVSVIRACSMGLLAIINRRLKMKLSSFDIFALVFIWQFFLNPQVIYQGGFQFSYWISFVLICSKTTLRGLGNIKSRITIVYLARMAAIPLSVASSYEISITAYLSSLLVSPILMSLIIPALLITLLLPPLAPVMDILLQSFEQINRFLEQFLTIDITFGAVSLPIVVLLMSLLLASCYLYEKHQKLLTRLALIGLYAFILEMNRIWQTHTTITFLDVGQGDAVIIRSPYQACNVVIDTGGDVSRIRSNNPSIFSHTLEPYLLGSGVRNIDFLILTHEHYDHIAEAIPLMSRFNVQNIILSEATHDNQMREIVYEAEKLNIPILTARPLDTFTCGNQVYTFIHDKIDNLDVNEDSLVMTVEIDGFNILLTGDIGHETEPAILENNHLDYFHVYQVAHHGSRHSNSYDFMSSLNITYAVVQVGRNNFYGHPHAELFEVANELEITVLNNAKDGTVQFKLLRGSYHIHTWPREQLKDN